MKERYEDIECDIITFRTDDVICSSRENAGEITG